MFKKHPQSLRRFLNVISLQIIGHFAAEFRSPGERKENGGLPDLVAKRRNQEDFRLPFRDVTRDLPDAAVGTPPRKWSQPETLSVNNDEIH